MVVEYARVDCQPLKGNERVPSYCRNCKIPNIMRSVTQSTQTAWLKVPAPTGWATTSWPRCPALLEKPLSHRQCGNCTFRAWTIDPLQPGNRSIEFFSGTPCRTARRRFTTCIGGSMTSSSSTEVKRMEAPPSPTCTMPWATKPIPAGRLGLRLVVRLMGDLPPPQRAA